MRTRIQKETEEREWMTAKMQDNYICVYNYKYSTSYLCDLLFRKFKKKKLEKNSRTTWLEWKNPFFHKWNVSKRGLVELKALLYNDHVRILFTLRRNNLRHVSILKCGNQHKAIWLKNMCIEFHRESYFGFWKEPNFVPHSFGSKIEKVFSLFMCTN